mmetsp:Transcript_114905/g.371363  ORF Transcript_114905/g.371363 Transcript_114905/m.371363 type:complete len:223 (-) Transcript_114905:1331-1999(-)
MLSVLLRRSQRLLISCSRSSTARLSLEYWSSSFVLSFGLYVLKSFVSDSCRWPSPRSCVGSSCRTSCTSCLMAVTVVWTRFLADDHMRQQTPTSESAKARGVSRRKAAFSSCVRTLLCVCEAPRLMTLEALSPSFSWRSEHSFFSPASRMPCNASKAPTVPSMALLKLSETSQPAASRFSPSDRWAKAASSVLNWALNTLPSLLSFASLISCSFTAENLATA